MAQAKKRVSKKKAAKRQTPAQKRVAKAAENKRRQNLRGAAANSAKDAALKRARNPAGVRATLGARERARERRMGVDGTVVSPSAQRALEEQAKQRGFSSATQALRARGAVLRQGRVSLPTGRANVYAKSGRMK